MNFQRAYLSRLLSLPLLDLGVTGIFVLVTQRFSVIYLVAIGLLLLSLGAIAIGLLLYQPILAFEKNIAASTDEIKLAASKRLRGLPWYSALASFSLTVVYIFTASALRVYTPEDAPLDTIDTLTVAEAVLWYSVAFGIFYGYFIYFVVNDLVIKMRRRYHVAFSGGGVGGAGQGFGQESPLVRKLAATFIVIGIMPALMVGLDLTIFEPIRTLQGLTTDQIIALDLICAVYVVVVSIVFVSRSLLAPIRELNLAQDAVRQGNLDHQAAVLTNDELGAVTGRFNVMVDALRERELIKRALNRHLSPNVAAELIRQGGTISSRSVEATVMFTDVDGFTALSATLGPEMTIELLNQYFDLISRLIDEAGGTVNNFIGDAVVAIFNVPVADTKHAHHAVCAAMAIVRACKDQTFILSNGAAIKLPTRVGINTGPVCAGMIGSADRQGYTVYGDAVNLAARIEPLNKTFKTRILASARTIALAHQQGAIDAITTNLGEVMVAGRSEPVTVYAIAAPASA